MARLTKRLKALEAATKREEHILPLMIIVGESGLTDSQKLEIAEAERDGQNVIMIVRDDYSHG